MSCTIWNNLQVFLAACGTALFCSSGDDATGAGAASGWRQYRVDSSAEPGWKEKFKFSLASVHGPSAWLLKAPELVLIGVTFVRTYSVPASEGCESTPSGLSL